MKKFNHLNIPQHWEQYWSKYPNGYSILESLIDWVSQVDDMVDNQNQTVDTVENFGDRLDEFLDEYDESLSSTLEDTLSEWQTSGFLDVVIDAALQTQIDDVGAQLTQTEQQILLSKFNLSTSSDEAEENFVKLCNAIEKGQTILVDNIYPIKATTPYTINKFVKLRGLNNQTTGLNVIEGHTFMFELSDSVTEIKIENMFLTGHPNVMFANLNFNGTIEKIIFDDNVLEDIKGSFLFMFNEDDDERQHIHYISVKRNKLKNVDSPLNGAHFNYKNINRTLRGFLQIRNLNHSNAEVKHNEIANTENVFCYIEKVPTFTQTNDVEVSYNTFINNNKISNNSQARYHAFVFLRAKNVTYSNNHVEGLVGLDQQTIDAYLSCDNVVYQHNKNINNFCVGYDVGDSEYTNPNVLMKSKAPSTPNVKGTRVYLNNEFVLDKSKVSGLSYGMSWGSTLLYETSNNMRLDWTIENNKIDVPVLRLQPFAADIPNLLIKNLDIECEYISGSFVREANSGNNASIDGLKIKTSKTLGQVDEYKLTPSFNFQRFSIINQPEPLTHMVRFSINNSTIYADFEENIFHLGGYNLFEIVDCTLIDLKKESTLNSSALVNILNVRDNQTIKNLTVFNGRQTQSLRTSIVDGLINYNSISHSLNSILSLSTAPFVEQTSSDSYSVFLEVKLRKNLEEKTGLFIFLIENGKITYRSDNETLEYMLTGNHTGTAVYIDSVKDVIPLRLRIFDNGSNLSINSARTETINQHGLTLNLTIMKN